MTQHLKVTRSEIILTSLPVTGAHASMLCGAVRGWDVLLRRYGCVITMLIVLVQMWSCKSSKLIQLRIGFLGYLIVFNHDHACSGSSELEAVSSSSSIQE